MAFLRRRRILRWVLLIGAVLVIVAVVLYRAALPGYLRSRVVESLEQAGVRHVSFQLDGVGLTRTVFDRVAFGSTPWFTADHVTASYAPHDLFYGRLGELEFAEAHWRVSMTNGQIDWGFQPQAGDESSRPFDLPVERLSLRRCVIEAVIDGEAHQIAVDGTVSRRGRHSLSGDLQVRVHGEQLNIHAELVDAAEALNIAVRLALPQQPGARAVLHGRMAHGDAQLPHRLEVDLAGLDRELVLGGRTISVDALGARGLVALGDDGSVVDVQGDITAGRASLDGWAVESLAVNVGGDGAGDHERNLMAITARGAGWTVERLTADWRCAMDVARGHSSAPCNITLQAALHDASALNAVIRASGVSIELPGSARIAGALEVGRSTAAGEAAAWSVTAASLAVTGPSIAMRRNEVGLVLEDVRLALPIAATVHPQRAVFRSLGEVAMRAEQLEIHAGEYSQQSTPLEMQITASGGQPLLEIGWGDVLTVNTSVGISLASRLEITGQVLSETVDTFDAQVSYRSAEGFRAQIDLRASAASYAAIEAREVVLSASKSPGTAAVVHTLDLDLDRHGRFSADAFAVDPSTGGYASVLCRGLELGAWLPTLSGGRLNGEGVLHGRLHVGLGVGAGAHTFRFGTGFLEARPRHGWFAIQDEEIASRVVTRQFEQGGLDDAYRRAQASIVAALQGFDFTELQLDFDPQGDDVLCRVETAGKGRRGDPPIEFASLTMNINEFERVFNEVLGFKAAYDRLTNE